MISKAALLRMQAEQLVRVWRSELEPWFVDARIAAVTPKLLALAVISDKVVPDGFSVFRRADVTRIEPAPHAGFQLAALKLRGHALPRLPKLDLTSWRTVVQSAAKRFPLVTVHWEQKDPDVCYIGRPLALTARGATFLTISPDATWDRDDPLHFKWSDLTRVDFGGSYEDALALVAAQA